jgi:hypothetical protein
MVVGLAQDSVEVLQPLHHTNCHLSPAKAKNRKKLVQYTLLIQKKGTGTLARRIWQEQKFNSNYLPPKTGAMVPVPVLTKSSNNASGPKELSELVLCTAGIGIEFLTVRIENLGY